MGRSKVSRSHSALPKGTKMKQMSESWAKREKSASGESKRKGTRKARDSWHGPKAEQAIIPNVNTDKTRREAQQD